MMIFSLANKMLTKILFWREVHLERSQLSKMSDDLLKDIGVSKVEADHEASRPFWDTSPFEYNSRLKRQTLH